MNKKPASSFFPWLLVAYEMIIYLSMDLYVPALPTMAKTFSVSVQLAQYTAIIWMVGGLVVQPIFGPVSDRVGRRPLILYGGLLFIVSSTLCALAPTIDMLLMARFFQGIAMPTMFIAGYAAVNEYFESQAAISILARMNAVTILAPAFGPMLGGVLLLYTSWRWIFYLLAIGALLFVALLFLYLPETLPKQQRTMSLKLSVIVEQYWMVVKNKQFMCFTGITFLPIIGLIAWMMVGPFVIQRVFHYSNLVFGVVQLFVFASFILGTKLVSWFASEKCNHLFVNIGLGFAVVGSLALWVATYQSPRALLLPVFFLMLTTLGSGMIIPILSRLTLETSQAPMGIKVTVFSILRISSGIIGSVCISLFYTGSLFSMASIMLLFTLLALVLRVSTRH